METHIISNISFACATERLNGKGFTLFHLGLVAALDNRHRLPAVNAIPADAMPVQVADALDRVALATNLALVALHDLLNGSTNVRHAYVNASLLDTGVGGILARIDQIVVGRVEMHGEGRIDNAAVDVHTKVDLHDVLLLEDHLVAGIRGVVGSAVVDAQAGGEAHAALERVTLFEALMPREGAHRVLDALSNLGQSHARLNPFLCPLAHLAMHLGAPAVVGQEVLVHAVEMALLFAGGPVRVLVAIFDDLALGVGIVEVDFVDGDARGCRLHLGPAGSARLFLLARLALLFLLCGTLGSAFMGAVVGFGVVVRVVAVYVAMGAALRNAVSGACIVH